MIMRKNLLTTLKRHCKKIKIELNSLHIREKKINRRKYQISINVWKFIMMHDVIDIHYEQIMTLSETVHITYFISFFKFILHFTSFDLFLFLHIAYDIIQYLSLFCFYYCLLCLLKKFWNHQNYYNQNILIMTKKRISTTKTTFKKKSNFIKTKRK